MKKYEIKNEEIWRNYEGYNMKKYENNDFPYIWAVGLLNLLFRGGGGVVRNFQV